MNVGFAHLASIVPTTSESVFDMPDEPTPGPAEAELLRLNGLSRVPVMAAATTCDLMVAALGKLLGDAPAPRLRIGQVMFVHSLPAPVPSGKDLVSACLDPLGLSDVPAVQVTGQPCAIMHHAIALARDWVAKAGGEALLIVGADRPNHPGERLFFGSAMGDGAVAGLIAPDTSGHRLLACRTETMIHAWEGELSPANDIARFRAANPASIRSAVMRCAEDAGLTMNDIALICPHTPNRPIWDAVAELLRVSRDRIFDEGIARTGHLNSNDSFIHYLDAIESGRIRRGDAALLINPGFGGTRGCTLIRY